MRETVITANKTYLQYFKELVKNYELFWFLAWRDIVLHYKQTAVGVIWVLLRPLLTVLVFTLIFSRVVGVAHEQTPYPLLVLSGMLVWQFFIDIFVYGSNSFLHNAQLISKVYFPRLFLPASRILCSLIDFTIIFLFYLVLVAVRYGQLPTIKILYLPLCLLWLCLVSFFVSLLFATLIVRFRDFKHVIPFIGQLGLYATPVGFTVGIIPDHLKLLFFINPCAGVINFMRWILLNEQLYLDGLLVSLIATFLLAVIALRYFKYSENTLVDVI